MRKVCMFVSALLLFFTPLVFVSNTNELFEFPKMFFVYVAGVLLTALFALSLVFRPRSPRKLVYPPAPVLVYVLVQVAAAAFSSYPYTSLWGYYTRFNGGLISTLIYLGIYFVAVNTLKPGDFYKLFKLVLFGAAPIALLAVFQHYGISREQPIVRAYSTFGQPNWLAQYLLVQMFIAVSLFVSEPRSRRLLGFLFVLIFAAFLFTYSMSGILGFILAFGAFAYLYRVEIRRSARSLLVLVLVCGLITALNPGVFGGRLKDAFTDVKRFLGSSGLVYASDASGVANPGPSPSPNPSPSSASVYQLSDPGFIREGLWLGTWHLIVSAPKTFLIGTGPETYPYAFQQFRPLTLNYSSEWDFVFNKPHNYYLQIWSESGLLGLLAYIYLLTYLFLKSPKYVIPALVSFAATNFFGWPVTATSLFFWFSLAQIGMSAEEGQILAEGAASKKEAKEARDGC